MKKIITIIIAAIAPIFAMAAINTAVERTELSGKIIDEKTKEPLAGVTLQIPELSEATTSNSNGVYQFTNLPKKTVTLEITYIGHQTIIKKINLLSVTHQNFELKESNAEINEVVVTGLTGSTLLKYSPTPVSILTKRQLLENSSTNIIDAIAHQPGISQVTTGNGISKPVIRGLGYNRVVTIHDGIRQEGQQWGDEHGIEIDPQTVNSVEILKGPASLRYGSDAMAGVVIFHDQPTPSKGSIIGNVTSEYQTNSGLFDYSLLFGGNKKGFVWSTRYSDKMAHAYKNKYDGYVYGSQFRERAFSGLLGINKSWGFSHLKLSYYHLTPGIVEGERDELTGKFTKGTITNGEETSEIVSRHDLKTYGKELPYQQIHHYKAVLDNSFYIGKGYLKTILGYQQNRRQEFEEIETPNTCGLDFQLHTINYDVNYRFDSQNEWSFATGVNGMYQRSLNKGEEFLIPAYALFDIGVFATTDYKSGPWNISGGLRFDNRHLHSFALADRFNKFTRSFNSITGSIGAVYAITPQMNVRLNVARGFRAPNLSELGANGEHEGTFRYERGNSDLKPEYSWQIDARWDYTSPYITTQISLFTNFIQNYIFLRKNGNERIDDTPVYIFTQGNAKLLGGEASIDIHPIDVLHFENTFSYVNAIQNHQSKESKYLPMTPSPRFTSEIKYEFMRHGKVFNNSFAKFGLEYNLRQNHFYAAEGTETATPAYTLLNATIGTDILSKMGKKILSVFFTGENLADRAYQDHLSRLKYADVNEVSGRKGVFNMGRNFTFKVVIPIGK